MNAPAQNRLFLHHAVVARTMLISLWREHMQSAIQACLAAAVGRKPSRSRKSRERKLSVGKGEV